MNEPNIAHRLGELALHFFIEVEVLLAQEDGNDATHAP